jgi:hypothetical protein
VKNVLRRRFGLKSERKKQENGIKLHSAELHNLYISHLFTVTERQFRFLYRSVPESRGQHSCFAFGRSPVQTLVQRQGNLTEGFRASPSVSKLVTLTMRRAYFARL